MFGTEEKETIEQDQESPRFEVVDGQLVSNREEQVEEIDSEEQSADSPEDIAEQEAQPDQEPNDDNVKAEDSEKTDEPSTATSDEPEIDDTEFYSSLSKEVGVDLNNEDDITSALKEYAQLKQQGSLMDDPELKAFYEFKQKGGDTKLYHSLQSKDFDSLDTKSLLREQFMLDNAALASENKKLAELEFNQEYNSKYGLLDKMQGITDEDELEDFKAENGQQIEVMKERLDYAKGKATKALTEWKNKSIQPPQPEEQTSPEEIQQAVDQFNREVEEKVRGFEGLAIEMGDGIEAFKVDFSKEELSDIQDLVQNPMKFLSEYAGITDKGITDVNKLINLVAKNKKFGQVGRTMSDYVLEQKNLQTIEAKTTNPPRNVNDQSSSRTPTSMREALLNSKVI